MALKYIVGRHGDMVLFTGGMSHDTVARQLGWNREDISGAGFVHGLGGNDADAMEENIKTVGHSATLNIQADPEDKWRLVRELRGY